MTVVMTLHKLMSPSQPVGFAPHAYKTAGNAQTWRTPTEAPYSKCEEDRRRCEREGGSWEEYHRRSVSLCKNGSDVSNIRPVNLALAMARTSRKRVGILDLDIFGPSIPTLMGLNQGGEPELTNGMSPGTAYFAKTEKF